MASQRPSICRSCGQLMGTQSVCPYCGASRHSPLGFVKGFLRSRSRHPVSTTRVLMWYCGFIFVVTLLISLWLGGVSSLVSALMSPDQRALLVTGITGPFVFKGLWWGPLTSVFLHIGLIHLGFNLYALSIVGPLIERTVGSRMTWILFLISGSSGALLTSYMGNHAAGASGAIFGLIGTGIVISYRLGHGMQDPVLRTLLTWAALTFFIGLMPGLNLDNWGHFGGLITGAALSFVWVEIRRSVLLRKLLTPISLFLVLLVVAAYASMIQTFFFSGTRLP